MRISGKQESVLSHLYYGKGPCLPRRTSWRTSVRLKTLGLMTFNVELCAYEITDAGRKYLEARPYHEANAWLWK